MAFKKTYSLIIMLEKWRKAFDKEKEISNIFMNFSKAFDTIYHDLLLAKLRTYGFSKQALSPVCNLKNRKQSVQINNKFSSLKEVIAGVPHVSIDRTLFFNLFVNDMFLLVLQPI